MDMDKLGRKKEMPEKVLDKKNVGDRLNMIEDQWLHTLLSLITPLSSNQFRRKPKYRILSL